MLDFSKVDSRHDADIGVGDFEKTRRPVGDDCFWHKADILARSTMSAFDPKRTMSDLFPM